VAALAGCGGGAHDGGVAATTARVCAQLRPGANVSYTAVVRRPVVAFRRPGRDRIARFGLVNVNGVETVFAVRGIS